MAGNLGGGDAYACEYREDCVENEWEMYRAHTSRQIRVSSEIANWLIEWESVLPACGAEL